MKAFYESNPYPKFELNRLSSFRDISKNIILIWRHPLNYMLNYFSVTEISRKLDFVIRYLRNEATLERETSEHGVSNYDLSFDTKI